MKIGLVIPILSQFKLALEAVESIVSDNHTIEFYPINNWKHKYSVAKSWNVGMERAIDRDCDYVIISNDDVVAHKYAVDAAVDVMEAYPDLGLLTFRDYRDRLSGPELLVDFDITKGMEFDMSEVADFSCFMIRPECYMKIGLFDETFTPAYFEDNDYYYRIKLSDIWDVCSYGGCAIYHYGSTTQNNTGIEPVCTSPQFEANREYYKRKWGGEPGKEVFVFPFNI